MTPEEVAGIDALIPRIWAAGDCRRLGLEPTPENIEAVMKARREQAEEDSKWCHECGQEKP